MENPGCGLQFLHFFLTRKRESPLMINLGFSVEELFPQVINAG